MRVNAPSIAKCAPALLAVTALAAGCGGGTDRASYAVRLDPVGGSGVRGSGRLSAAGGSLAVTVDARGLTPRRIHEERLVKVGCSTVSGSSASGGFPLQPYPTVGARGRLRYRLTFTVPADRVEPLGQRSLVLYGTVARSPKTHSPEYFPHRPVACGPLQRTGSGG